jgi:hypothetical protein
MGTLIFIGIMFTSVVPMLLIMKQADTIYEQKIDRSIVLVKRGSTTIHDENVTMNWPNGPSVLWVYS